VAVSGMESNKIRTAPVFRVRLKSSWQEWRENSTRKMMMGLISDLTPDLTLPLHTGPHPVPLLKERDENQTTSILLLSSHLNYI